MTYPGFLFLRVFVPANAAFAHDARVFGIEEKERAENWRGVEARALQKHLLTKTGCEKVDRWKKKNLLAKSRLLVSRANRVRSRRHEEASLLGRSTHSRGHLARVIRPFSAKARVPHA